MKMLRSYLPDPYFLPESLKQFFVSSALRAIRLLVILKPTVIGFFSILTRPFVTIGKVMLAIFIPFYHLTYQWRRSLEHIWRPAKNKVMFVVTNRYTVHAVMLCLAIFSAGLNLHTTEVRAETFGEKSLIHQMIATQDTEIIEEFAITESPEIVSVYYRDPGALSALQHGGDDVTDDVSVPLVFGGSLTMPPIAQSAISVAPRVSTEAYVVQSGDTLSTIAEQFGLSINTLLWSNNLSVRSILRPGDSLTILPVSGVQHTVKSGDTLTKIASRYSVQGADILAFNKLPEDTKLSIGQTLIVPGGVMPAPVPVKRSVAIGQAIGGIPASSSSAAPTTPGSGNMIWPTDLRTITQYFGWRHTGIDVDCHFDNDNYAADDGIVQFAGWKGGYGNAVEVNHGNGIVTRYGHHASIYVKAGQQVSKGTALGRCGTTGRSTGTHLHFEVMVNSKFKNPLEYLR